jgi:cytochrome P450
MPLPRRRESLTLSNARAMSADGPAFLLHCARTLGPSFKVGLGPVTLTIVGEPELLQHVLQKRAAHWVRGSAVNGVRPLLGNGLPMSDPPLWLTQRRTMQPSFHKGSSPRWVELMGEVIAKHLDAVKEGDPVVTHHLMMNIARDVIMRAMFSGSLDGDIARVDDALKTVEDFVAAIAMSPVALPDWVPTPLRRRFKAASAYLNGRLAGVIEERRALESPPTDLLTMLVRARDPEGGAAMSDQQLRDEVMNIFFAGHETTANLLTWATWLLHQHPEVRDRAKAEIDEVCGARRPTSEEVGRLQYVGAIVRETLRLYPPAWFFARQSLDGDELAGEPIAKGDVVLVSPLIAQRDAASWPEPDRFDPSRFAGETSIDAAHWKYRFLPFGAGPHVCIGNHFAMLEATTVLAMHLQRGRFDVIGDGAVRPRIGATLGVEGGLPVRFVARAR